MDTKDEIKALESELWQITEEQMGLNQRMQQLNQIVQERHKQLVALRKQTKESATHERTPAKDVANWSELNAAQLRKENA